MVAMQWIAVDALKPNPRNARTHSRKQIRQIADSITAFGFLVPILIDDGGNIIAGGGSIFHPGGPPTENPDTSTDASADGQPTVRGRFGVGARDVTSIAGTNVAKVRAI